MQLRPLCTISDYTIEITGAETIASTETPDVNGNVSKTYEVSTDGKYEVTVTSNGDHCIVGGRSSLYLDVHEVPSDPIIAVSPNQTTFCEGDLIL